MLHINSMKKEKIIRQKSKVYKVASTKVWKIKLKQWIEYQNNYKI